MDKVLWFFLSRKNCFLFFVAHGNGTIQAPGSLYPPSVSNTSPAGASPSTCVLCHSA